jgi:large subunit ribosomal protein L32
LQEWHAPAGARAPHEAAGARAAARSDDDVVEEFNVGALPKKRVSHSRQGNRRAHHKVKIPQLTVCKQCGHLRQSHHVCPNCGTYRGRQVLQASRQRASAE